MWPLFSSCTPWSFSSILAKDHCVDSNGGKRTLRERVVKAINSSPNNVSVSLSARVFLLTGMRIFGVEFNPVSFYFVYEQNSSTVDYVVAEVNNIPWLEQHIYVLTPEELRIDGTEQRVMRRFHGHPKVFHVSPFIDMADVTYSWLISDPSQKLRMKIGLQRSGKSFFMAGLHVCRYKFSALNLIKFQITKPFQTCKIIGAIMWEAAKLFKRGFQFVPHPQNTETAASRAIATVVRCFTSIRSRFVGKPVMVP